MLRAMSVQVTMTAWFLSTLLLTIYYTATIKSMYMEVDGSVIIRDLETALQNPQMEFIIPADSYELNLFEDGRGVFNDAWVRIQRSKDNIKTEEEITKYAYHEVENSPDKGIITTKNMAQVTIKNGNHTRLFIADRPVASAIGHMMWGKTFKHKELFDCEIDYMQRGGMLYVNI